MKKLIALFMLIIGAAFAQAATEAKVGESYQLIATAASGTKPFKFTWFKNNQPIVNQTTDTLLLNNVQLSDAGNYSVAIENSAGRADAPALIFNVTQIIVVPGGVTITITKK